MKVYIFLGLALCAILIHEANSEIRYKFRGPPSPPRPPVQPHYIKSKWPGPPRYPIRNIRPIPVHMSPFKNPNLYKPIKSPQFLSNPPKVGAPFIFSGAVWKAPQNVYKPVADKPIFSYPPVNDPYSFAIHKEPHLHSPTIKQIGEKGPIHTIPAPNLSPADKPAVILEDAPHKHTYQYEKEPELFSNSITNQFTNAQALPLQSNQHQYQVTEQTDSAQHDHNQHNQNQHNQNQHNQYSQKPLFAPDPDQNIINQFPQYLDTSSLSSDLKVLKAESYVGQQHNGGAQDVQLSPQELYHLLNGVPQQQLIDSYGTPLVQQPQLQQHFVQQASLANPSYTLMNTHLFHEEPTYVNQVPDSVSQAVKDNFKPQFHTFNYEEQASSPEKEYAQSRVTADYTLDPVAAEDTQSAVVQKNANDEVAQSQYIQQYYGAHSDNVIENNVDPETKPSQQKNDGSQLLTNSEISPSMFYSSLPNKEAADAFASLQAAGSGNNEKVQFSKKDMESHSERDSMKIYVPDEEESYEDSHSQHQQQSGERQGIKIYETTYTKQEQHMPEKNDSMDYEDYSQEHESEQSQNDRNEEEISFASQSSFGSRLRPKKSHDMNA